MFFICLQMQVNTNFSNLQGNANFIEKSGSLRNQGKITVFDQGEGKNFWFQLSRGLKNQGFEKWGFHYNNLVFLKTNKYLPNCEGHQPSFFL